MNNRRDFRKELIRKVFPYCITKTKNGYMFLNREYKPIGFNNNCEDWVDYEEFPLNHNLGDKFFKVKFRDEDKSYFLYNDSTAPYLSKTLFRRYMENLIDIIK